MPTIALDFSGPLADDHAAQKTIEDRFRGAFRDRVAALPDDAQQELSFVEAWRDVQKAFPEWADHWGARRHFP